MKSRKIHFIRTAVTAAFASLASFNAAHAETYYWDADGAATAGFTTAATGTWGTSAFWSTDITGSTIGANTAITTADDVNFGTATSGFSLASTVGFSGAQSVRSITIGAGNTNTLLFNTTGPLTLGSGSVITNNSASAVTITAQLASSNGFEKAGTGLLVVNNTTNTISGQVVISGGTLDVRAKPLSSITSVALNAGTLLFTTTTAGALGGTITFGGGSLQFNSNVGGTDYSAQFSTAANQTYRIAVANNVTATFSSDLASVGGTLAKSSPGTLILAAASTFTGNTTVTGGNLQLNNASALQNSAINTTGSIVGNATVGLVLTGVTSPTFGGLTGNKTLSTLFDTDSGNYGLVTNVTLNPGTGATPSYAAAIADGAAGMTLTKSGDGTQTLTVANSYTGGTILSGGTLNYGNATALSSGPIAFTGNSIVQAGFATTLANAVTVSTGVTGTLDTVGFATTLSQPLTGAGTLAKSGVGILTLTGGVANNLSGGINVNAGRLQVLDGLSLANTAGAITVASGAAFNYSKNFALGNNLPNALNLSGPGLGTLGALNLQGNAIASGAITLAADTTISHDFNSATISNSITGTNRNLTLTTVNPAQAALVISASISLGTGGITVNSAGGTNTVILSGNNTYSGDTRVATGILTLSGVTRVPDASTVRIVSGAVLNLDFAGSDTVAALFLPGDPNPKPNGTYGSSASSATNQSADFLGTGVLQVGPPANNFASWASSQVPPVTGGANGDDNNNGVSNLVEYALTDGGERGVFSGTTITFTKRGLPYGNDLTYIIETSETLVGSWSPEVTQGPAELGSPISYNLNPVPSTPKKFARLKVVKVP